MTNDEQINHRQTPEGLRPQTDISKWLWLAPAIVLLIAILPLPYVYYVGMRWIVAGAAGYLAWQEFSQNGQKANSYVWVFGVIALVFNPIMPIHLFKVLWIAINLASTAVFLGHYRLCQQGS